MKYVALLSGGKDSCFNLLHCRSNGHTLVAAATLSPEQGKDELDSYLYQTVGQDAIQLVADALDVPLYRRVITGKAVEQGSEYGPRDSKTGIQGDETEDLYALLSIVQSHHPDIQAVSVGAILSNYQRVRVEHVCRRLSLTCLCYLWQRSQQELLAEMIEAGMQSILIKVAGIGLEVKHLGKTLAEMQSTLVKLNSLYGSHICGEGGEYETLTLDCPLFKSRIVLKEVETVIHSDSDFATVAFLKVKDAYLSSKSDVPSFRLQVPPLLDDIWCSVRDEVGHPQEETEQATMLVQICNTTDPGSCIASSKRVRGWVTATNIQVDFSEKANMTFLEEVAECFQMLKGHLYDHGLELMHAAHINMFLSSMDLFTEANSVYSTFFGTSPPSRACVAVDLPSPNHVRLDCIASIEGKAPDRQALHVQSLSYWAPANIGPYSQAIVTQERVFISGQIGLVPSSLSLPSPASLATETALAMQHVNRVVAALQAGTGGGWLGRHQIAIYWLVNVEDIPRVRSGHKVYEETYSPMPTLFLVVLSLPRNALVEKQAIMHTGRFTIDDEEDGQVVFEPQSSFARGASEDQNVEWQVFSFDKTNSTCVVICIRGDEDLPWKVRKLIPMFDVLSVRLFYNISRCGNEIPASLRHLYAPDALPVSPIPCRSIATMSDQNWDYAICILTA